MLNKILTVARTEFIETVRTKAFIIGMVLAPILMAAFIFLPAMLAKKSFTEERPPRHLAVVIRESGLSAALDNAFSSYNSYTPHRRILLEPAAGPAAARTEGGIEELKSRVSGGELDGLLVIDDGILDGEGGSTLYTHKVSDVDFYSRVRNLVRDAVRKVRYEQSGVPGEVIERINSAVPLEQVDLEAGRVDDSERLTAMMLPFAFMFLMFMGIIITGNGLLNTVIEEKSTRIIEVLLAAVTPFELMTGKILGQSAVGFALLSFYGASGLVAASFRDIRIPVTPALVVYFIVFFVLGFLLFASLFAAVGSAVNSVKESQSLLSPITMLAVVPMMAWFYIAQNPSGTFSVVLSLIPPITPLVMILRLAVDPGAVPAWQIIVSLLLLGGTVLLALWAASRVFRIGVLMYGKPPTPRELIRWIRQA